MKTEKSKQYISRSKNHKGHSIMANCQYGSFNVENYIREMNILMQGSPFNKQKWEIPALGEKPFDGTRSEMWN